jgi:predicted transcriptional regulator
LPLLNSPVKVPLVTDVGYTGRVLQLGGDGAGTAPFLLDSTFSTEASPVPSLEAAPQDAGSALALPTRGQPPALAVGGAALAVAFLAMAAKLALAPLFTRLRSSRLLEHPVRARLHEAVLAEPGIHYLRLQERTGVPRGTLDHHLRKLVEGGILHREQGQGFVCYFAGVPDADALAAAPALKSEAARTLLRLIHGRPGTTAQHLAQELGVQPSSVAHHIDRMVQAGLVERVRAGRAYALAATRRGAKAVGTS